MTTEWNNEASLKLIELYKKHPVLWNRKHFDYYNRECKRNAWINIGKNMHCSPAILRRKLESLSASFRREKIKFRKFKTVAGHNNYNSNWFAFKAMSFLLSRKEMNPQLKLLNKRYGGMKNDEEVVCKVEPEESLINENEDVLDTYIEFNDTSVPIQKPVAPEIITVNELLEMHDKNDENKQIVVNVGSKETFDDSQQMDVQTTNPSFDTIQPTSQHWKPNSSYADNCSIYGQYVANKLRDYDKRTRAIVEHHINNILFNGEMGKYENLTNI